jgi:hypothetical protein
MRVATAMTIGEDIELDLADAAVELLRERLVLVVEAFEVFSVIGLPERCLAGRNAGVVAVVRADDLDLVEPQRGVDRCCL